ncbi:MAG: hypothetical protein ABSF44_09165 [Candidatus Bathyarchaeia archaeon]
MKRTNVGHGVSHGIEAFLRWYSLICGGSLEGMIGTNIQVNGN